MLWSVKAKRMSVECNQVFFLLEIVDDNENGFRRVHNTPLIFWGQRFALNFERIFNPIALTFNKFFEIVIQALLGLFTAQLELLFGP